MRLVKIGIGSVLPTYNVFYEARTFSRGAPGLALEAGGVPVGDYLFEFDFGLVSVEVCEDVWSPDGPMRRRCYSGAELVLNVSSSPFRVGVMSTRREMLATRSADNEATLDGGEPTEITWQNVQARIRTGRMWNWANSSGALFGQTGDGAQGHREDVLFLGAA